MKHFFLALLLFVGVFAFAEGTQTWEESKFEDFQKGTATGVAIRSDGALELAPAFKPLYTSPSTFLWAITSDRNGVLYAAAGAPARVYRITPDGKAEVIFEPKELQVQALIERNGVLYAATSPDGKVYKLEREAAPPAAGAKPGTPWKATTFFDPKTKYIWALAMDSQGALYVATGDQGQIFKVTPDGNGAVLFQTEDAHVRSLAFDSKGNLIAGTDGSGLIYRISPAGEAFVLYSAPKKEITALATDSQGNIYAAGDGIKRSTAPPAPPPAQTPQPGAQNQQPPAAPPPQPPNPPNPAAAAGGSDIYKIAADNAPALIWSSRDSIIYALSFARLAGEQQLIAGAGNKGLIFSIRDNGDFTNLVQASANQVTGFAPAPDGLYVSTSNLGKTFLLTSAPDRQGSFESDVFDAHIFSKWGRAELRSRGDVELEVRSGNVENPERDWSPWVRVNFTGPKPGEVAAPPARFVQWRAVLKASNPAPVVDSVALNYLSRNVAPVIDSVDVQVNGAPPAGSPNAAQSQNGPNAQPAQQTSTPANPAGHDHTVTVRWNAHDDNDDQLTYKLFYRGDGEANWKSLEPDPLTDKSYSFDGDLLPDGGYQIKVVASDAPSHSPEDALYGEAESARFEVDTTSPQVLDLHAAMEGGALHVTFRASDNFSAIHRAEFSLDAGDWQFVAPVGELSDSKNENYDFSIPVPVPAAPRNKKSPATADPNEHVLAVRAYDRFGNVGSGKVVIH